MDQKELITLLKPEATEEQVNKLCDEAAQANPNGWFNP